MKVERNSFFWWGKQLGIGIFSVFFLFMGIDTLISAYRLDNPHEFIMFFFSSNLMILISTVGLIGPAMRIYQRLKPAVTSPPKEE